MSKEQIPILLFSNFITLIVALIAGYLLAQTRYKYQKKIQEREWAREDEQKQKQKELSKEESEIYEWCKEQGEKEYLVMWSSTGCTVFSERISEEHKCSKEILESLAKKEWINVSWNKEGKICSFTLLDLT